MDQAKSFRSQKVAETMGAATGQAGKVSRRRWLVYGGCAAGAAAVVGGAYWWRYGLGAGQGQSWTDSLKKALLQTLSADSADVFKNDAPKGELWEAWQRRGWVREARHYLKLGQNIHCKLCPNECRLAPEDRGHCRNRVNKDGTLYTLAYGNACSFNNDPVEKKPLYHFLPGSKTFSFAISGCGFRCLNCQNWDISQRKPEESKDPRGESLRLRPETLRHLTAEDVDRLSLFPEDAVQLAEYLGSPSISYTYSEPTVWYEYMYDTAQLARQKGLKNVWVTCGYIQEKPLRELCRLIDAANVDLKSFSEEIYRTLNTGKLEPVLRCLKILKEEGVWFEVTNLVVPTYTDDLPMIRRMCQWMVQELGPDYPLHFSRFRPAHKLTNLPPTPAQVLIEARQIARECGLHYVYIGNVHEVEDAGITYCPDCKKELICREGFFVLRNVLKEGKCPSCGRVIAGRWA